MEVIYVQYSLGGAAIPEAAAALLQLILFQLTDAWLLTAGWGFDGKSSENSPDSDAYLSPSEFGSAVNVDQGVELLVGAATG